jgi:AcrR family transcriptional regulator
MTQIRHKRGPAKNQVIAKQDITSAASKILHPETPHEQRLLEIVKAAAIVFRERGYDAGTLEDIAQHLDMTRPALYHYVRSKQEILILTVNYLLDLALTEMNELEQQPDPRERLRALIVHLITLIGRERNFFTVFFRDKAGIEEPYLSMIQEKERAYAGAFRRAVRDAMAAGVLPTIPETLATQAILGMCNWTYQWLNPHGALPLEQAAHLMASFIIDSRPSDCSNIERQNT